MKKFIIINKESKQIVYKYEDEKKQSFGGAWGDEETHDHIEVLESIDLNYIKLDGKNIIEDTAKKEQDALIKQAEKIKKQEKEQAAINARKLDLNKIKDKDIQDALRYILKVIE